MKGRKEGRKEGRKKERKKGRKKDTKGQTQRNYTWRVSTSAGEGKLGSIHVRNINPMPTGTLDVRIDVTWSTLGRRSFCVFVLILKQPQQSERLPIAILLVDER